MKRFINNTKLAAGSFPTTLKKALLPAIALGILLLAGGATSAHAGEYSISKTVDSTTTTSLMRFDRLVESDLTEDICSMISPVKKLVKNARESVRLDLSSQCSGMPRGCAVACSQLPNPDNVPMKARYQLLSDSAEVFVGRVRGYPKQCGKRPVLYPRVEVDAFGEGVCGCTCTYTISVDAYDSSAVVAKSELTPEVRGGIFYPNPKLSMELRGGIVVGNPADTFTGAGDELQPQSSSIGPKSNLGPTLRGGVIVGNPGDNFTGMPSRSGKAELIEGMASDAN